MRFLPHPYYAIPALWLLAAGTVPPAAAGQAPAIPKDQMAVMVPPDKVPSGAARSPEAALRSFTLAPGIRLELAAAEPLVQDPVAIKFDAQGRMWVVELRGFMVTLNGEGENAPIGRISVLSDPDGDGYFDTAKVFLDGLVLARAVAFVGDGVLVAEPPELALWRDTDGDGRGDQKTVIATDYGAAYDAKRRAIANPQNSPNALLHAHDNWIYSAAHPKKYRFRGGQWETAHTPLRGQWGMSQDEFGRLYFGSNSVPLSVAVIPPAYAARNPNFPELPGTNLIASPDRAVWPLRVTPGVNRAYMKGILRPDGTLKDYTSAAGFWLYGGDLLPEFRGNVFVAEPAAHLVRREVPRAENGTVRSRNAYNRAEFIASDDERYRPVNFATGPDGALYVVDLYRGVLQHHTSLSHYLRRQIAERDLEHPLHLGRIYRVVPAQGPVPRVSHIPHLSSQAWLERLSHPNSWWRETAQRILVERSDRTTIPKLRQLALAGPVPVGRMHALWTLAGTEGLDKDTLLRALTDRDPVVLVAAIRIAEAMLPSALRPELVPRLLALARHASPEVQLQAVLTLGANPDPARARSLAHIVREHPQNTFLADAFFSGLANLEWEILEFAAGAAGWAPEDAAANRIVSGLARGIFTSRDIPAIERAIALAAAQLPSGRPRAAAILEGFIAASSQHPRGIRFARAPAGWRELEQNSELAPAVTKLNRTIIWSGKPGVPPLPEIQPLTAAQDARRQQGSELFNAICAACHQSSGRGLEGTAPSLLDSTWLLGSPEALARIVLHGKLVSQRRVGHAFMGDMPSFRGLDDEQLAAILTYARREWGNAASPIEPAQVKTVRAATADRADGWTEAELQALR